MTHLTLKSINSILLTHHENLAAQAQVQTSEFWEAKFHSLERQVENLKMQGYEKGYEDALSKMLRNWGTQGSTKSGDGR